MSAQGTSWLGHAGWHAHGGTPPVHWAMGGGGACEVMYQYMCACMCTCTFCICTCIITYVDVHVRVCGILSDNRVVVYKKLKQKTTVKATTNTGCYELFKCQQSTDQEGMISIRTVSLCLREGGRKGGRERVRDSP